VIERRGKREGGRKGGRKGGREGGRAINIGKGTHHKLLPMPQALLRPLSSSSLPSLPPFLPLPPSLLHLPVQVRQEREEGEDEPHLPFLRVFLLLHQQQHFGD